MTETPGARALRALADAVHDARPRQPGDIDDPGIPVAATVVVLRDRPGGPEVLVIERPDRGSFAGAWVFPGGKVEPEDAVSGDTEVDTARRAGVRETREEVGLDLDAGSLTTISRWDPPPGLPLRIRTWFFATRAPEAELVLAPDEVVAARWVRPEALLERHARGDVTLYPPTWVTLHSLCGQPEVDAVLAAARLRGVEQFESIVRHTPDGPLFLWQDDAEYAQETASEDASSRHRLLTGTLPWTYTRTP